MEKYRVRILDGGNINHWWTVEAENRHDAFIMVVESWKIYGKPYGIEKDGIKFSDVYSLKEIKQ